MTFPAAGGTDKLRDVDAMLLAAGRGTRLGPLGQRRAKVLVDIGGRPLLARQLDFLAGEAVDHVVINAHHLASQIEAFARHHAGPPALSTIVERALLGTAGGVRNALALIRSNPFIVLYGDVVVDQPLAPLVGTHRRAGAVATLAVHRADETSGKGVVKLAEDGRVTAFLEKTQDAAAPGFVNSGVYVLDRSFIADIPLGEAVDFGTDLFPSALDAGAHIYGHVLDRPVIDVGTPAGLDAARRLHSHSRRSGESG